MAKTLKTSPERLAYLAEWRAKNYERLKEYQAQWGADNKEKIATKAAKWVKNNPEKNALKSQRRRAKMRSCETYFINNKEMRKLYCSPCANCGSKENITLDHIIPISRGGRHSIGNLQSLCHSCNGSKHRRTIMEWRLNKRVSY